MESEARPHSCSLGWLRDPPACFVVVAVQSGTSLSLPEARFEIPEASGYHRRPTLAARAEVPSKVNLSLGPR